MSLSHPYPEAVAWLVMRGSRMKEQEGEPTRAFMTQTRNVPWKCFHCGKQGCVMRDCGKEIFDERKWQGKETRMCLKCNQTAYHAKDCKSKETNMWKSVETQQSCQ